MANVWVGVFVMGKDGMRYAVTRAVHEDQGATDNLNAEAMMAREVLDYLPGWEIHEAHIVLVNGLEDDIPLETPDLELWLRERPQVIKDLVAKCPPTTCYRLNSDERHGHYCISAYSEMPEGMPATMKMRHLRDSWGYTRTPEGQPDMVLEVFGVEAEDLVPCGCMMKEVVDG